MCVCILAAGLGVYYGQPVDETINEHQITIELLGSVQYYSKAQSNKGHLIIFAAAQEPASTQRLLARRWAEKGYVTSVIAPNFLSQHTQCINLPGAIAQLQHSIEQRIPAVKGLLPMLMGRGDAAPLSYIALAQAPLKTFHSAIAVDFCAAKPLEPLFCPQRVWSGEITATQTLGANFYVFQTPTFSAANQCDAAANKQFLQAMPSVKLSDSQSPVDEWLEVDALLNWLDPRLMGQALSGQNEGAAPVIEVPASNQKPTDYFVIFLTGDGGWAKLDKEIAQHFSAAGIPVLGFDALSYFWRKRNVHETALDISKLISQYQQKWQKKQVVMVGYSFGADVLPYVVANLPPEQHALVKNMVFLGLSRYAHFEFYLTNWMSAQTRTSDYPTQPKLATITSIPGLCLQGDTDSESICSQLQQSNITSKTLPGDHHYAEDYERVAQVILQALAK
ncbi:MAG: hypothetical protein RL497_2153 [Pseudomonadota bacterium]|jgi:type IV secretory pathway VirJ component